MKTETMNPQSTPGMNEIQLRVIAESPASASVSPPEQRRVEVGGQIQYRSRVMHELIHKANTYARSCATVLITGESGTGKEMFARLIHQASPRAERRFARVNCAALSESLMESELFGHERGAFTGATERRLGRFEWAEGGTLLLDEISEIPVAIQAKLLRVLEENEYQRVGSNQTLFSDVRVIATSNQDLKEQMELKQFRSDLYYRLNVLHLHLPPLRERQSDIALLTNQFIKRFAAEDSAGAVTNPRINQAALRKLCEYDWPGNIRQLRNVIHAACVMAGGDEIDVQHLPEFESRTTEQALPNWMTQMTLESVEKKLILDQLARFKGNKTLVAQALGVTPRTITNKLKAYQQKPDHQEEIEQGLLEAG